MFSIEMKGFTFSLLAKARKRLLSRAFCKRNRTSPKYFTRLRNMGFTSIMGLCLNFLKKSLQVEIDNYMELTDPAIEKPMTKQAFSKARHHISPDAFRELFEETVETAFEMDAFGKYKGYRVFAIDSTEMQLPQSKEILRQFKLKKGCPLPHARVSAFCDVLTGFTVHAVIETIATGDRDLAMEHLAFFEHRKQKKDLILFDRGYPSRAMIRHLTDCGFKYLMRFQKSFNKEIDNTDKSDFSVRISDCEVRVVKLLLPSGETETLITNLSKKEFKASEFQELYHLRWGIETKFNCLKNKLDIEYFSGKTLVTVLQDFYATLFLSNIASSMKMESDEAIRERNSGKSLKYTYVTNENVLIGKLKDKLIMILLNDDAAERDHLFNRLMSQLSNYQVAVVPDRQFPRPNCDYRRVWSKPKKAL
jgi:hypothetical protein